MDVRPALGRRRRVARRVELYSVIPADPWFVWGGYYEDGVWTARSGSLCLRWSGARAALRQDGGTPELVLDLGPGDRHDPVLEISEEPLVAKPVIAAAAWGATQGTRANTSPGLREQLASRKSRHSAQPPADARARRPLAAAGLACDKTGDFGIDRKHAT